MTMTGLDRRAVFFLLSGLICAVLVPLTPDELRWVGEVMVVTFVVLAFASWLDDRARARGSG